MLDAVGHKLEFLELRDALSYTSASAIDIDFAKLREVRLQLDFTSLKIFRSATNLQKLYIGTRNASFEFPELSAALTEVVIKIIAHSAFYKSLLGVSRS